MNQLLSPTQSKRLVSLDVFRGITIGGMVLVNNPGSWSHQYWAVGHAKWNGWTPTDLVFPFFLFIVGVAMTFSFEKRRAQGQSRIRLFEHVCRRTIILFLLGMTLAGFPYRDISNLERWRLIIPYIGFIIGLSLLFHNEPPFSLGKNLKERVIKILALLFLAGSTLYFLCDFHHFQTYILNKRANATIRIPGVLQRIALCYFFASLIMFFTRVRGRIIWAVGLIAFYWAVMKLVRAPAGYSEEVVSQDGLLNAWIDEKILGNHLYGERPDPEGLLSTLPAISTTLIGVLCGDWLHSEGKKGGKLSGLMYIGALLVLIGLFLDHGFPINKKIWTSSYVVFSGGMALFFLGVCFYLVDMKGIKKWAYPFLVFGTNPIFLYVGSAMMVRLTIWIRMPAEEVGKTISLRSWAYLNLFKPWLAPKNASLLFAIAYIFMWFLIMWPLYKKRIIIKV